MLTSRGADAVPGEMGGVGGAPTSHAAAKAAMDAATTMGSTRDETRRKCTAGV